MVVVLTISIPLNAYNPAIDNRNDNTLEPSLSLTKNESVENVEHRYKRKTDVFAGYAFAEKQKKARREWALAHRERKIQESSSETANYLRRFIRDATEGNQPKRVNGDIFESNTIVQPISLISVQKRDKKLDPQEAAVTSHDGAHFEYPVN